MHGNCLLVALKCCVLLILWSLLLDKRTSVLLLAASELDRRRFRKIDAGVLYRKALPVRFVWIRTL